MVTIFILAWMCYKWYKPYNITICSRLLVSIVTVDGLPSLGAMSSNKGSYIQFD